MTHGCIWCSYGADVKWGDSNVASCYACGVEFTMR